MSLRLATTAMVAVSLLLASAAMDHQKSLSIGALDDGSCDVHVHVSNPDKSPVPNAWVGVHVNKAGGEDNVALHTNSDGRAQFLGLPNAGTLEFTVRENGRMKQVSFAASEVCGSVAEVVLPAKGTK